MKNETENFKLGMRLKDKITGFMGIAIAKSEFMNGCVQYYLKARLDKDGKVQDAVVFDSQQLEFVDDGLSSDKEKKPTGGIMPDTPIIR